MLQLNPQFVVKAPLESSAYAQAREGSRPHLGGPQAKLGTMTTHSMGGRGGCRSEPKVRHTCTGHYRWSRQTSIWRCWKYADSVQLEGLHAADKAPGRHSCGWRAVSMHVPDPQWEPPEPLPSAQSLTWPTGTTDIP